MQKDIRFKFIKFIKFIKKPIQIREDTWEWYIKENKSTETEKWGKLMYDAGIINEPELLQNTVIELQEGVEFVIDANAAKDLSEKKTEITLVRLYDHTSEVFSYDDVIEAIQSGQTFDQLTKV